MFIRASIISGLLTDLSAASFGAVILVPGALPGRTISEVIFHVLRFLFIGTLFLVGAEMIKRGGDTGDNE